MSNPKCGAPTTTKVVLSSLVSGWPRHAIEDPNLASFNCSVFPSGTRVLQLIDFFHTHTEVSRLVRYR